MAITKGQGNPDWTKDETILALNLYFEFNGIIPGPNNEKIIVLSKMLNQLPIHPVELRKVNFRNPDGVAFKLQNIRSVATGKGLDNTSKMDKLVWQDFGNNPNEVKILVEEIINSISSFSEHDQLINEVEEEETFLEGTIITAVHKRRERSPTLRKKIIQRRKSEKKVYCDICGQKPILTAYIDDYTIFECHHILPLSESGIIETKIKDIAFICANCHRALHSMIIKEKKWIKPDEMTKLVNFTS